MDTGTILGFFFGYVATVAGVFLLYSPVLFLVIALLVAAGILKLLLLPLAILIRRIRRSQPERDMDSDWLLSPPPR